MTVMKSTIHQLDNGIILTLRHLPHKHSAPVIILCNGLLGGIRSALLPPFANAFTRAGFATITFDYLGIGESRSRAGPQTPTGQVEDILSVIAWVKRGSQKSLDPERIGLWGHCLGAGHVITAAANQPGVRCIVSQSPFSDGEAILAPLLHTADATYRGQPGGKLSSPRAAKGGSFWIPLESLLTDRESRYFLDDLSHLYPDVERHLPLATLRTLLRYKPIQVASQVTCPSLVVLAQDDAITPLRQGQALYETLASDDKQLCIIGEAGHYHLHYGAAFQQVLRAALQWFRAHMLATSPLS
ncbi:hypothetical protein CF126_09680 [Aeromonas dhakensis]|nr:hypothetical protein CF126_09680 [Aeromonas dhakensis]